MKAILLSLALLAHNDDNRSALFPNGMLNSQLSGNSYDQDQLIQQQQTQRTQMQNDADKQQTMMWVGGIVVAALILGLMMRGKKST